MPDLALAFNKSPSISEIEVAQFVELICILFLRSQRILDNKFKIKLKKKLFDFGIYLLFFQKNSLTKRLIEFTLLFFDKG